MSESTFRDSAAIVWKTNYKEAGFAKQEPRLLYTTKKFCEISGVKPGEMKNTFMSNFFSYCYINPEQRALFGTCYRERHPLESEYFVRLKRSHFFAAKMLILPIRKKSSQERLRFRKTTKRLVRSTVTHYVMIFSNIQQKQITNRSEIDTLSPAALVVYLTTFVRVIKKFPMRKQQLLAENILTLRLDGNSLLELSLQECKTYLFPDEEVAVVSNFLVQIHHKQNDSG